MNKLDNIIGTIVIISLIFFVICIIYILLPKTILTKDEFDTTNKFNITYNSFNNLSGIYYKNKNTFSLFFISDNYTEVLRVTKDGKVFLKGKLIVYDKDLERVMQQYGEK